MQVSSLQDICSQFIANNFRKFSVERIKCLPRPVLRYLGYQLSPLHLRRLEVALDTPLEQNQDIWLSQYAKHFALYYRRMFRIGDSSENQFCVVSKTDGDFRRIFLEDHFHLLLEDANKITILLHRGVLEVNVDTVEEGKEKICPHVKMEQIKSDMLLCAPFVKSLRIFRSKVLTSSMFKDVLDLLIDSVVCIRLVFLHDYRIMRDTIEHFVKHGNILDLHTIWQPQRCSLPPKYSVDILTLIAGLQLPGLTPINDEPVEEDTLSWNPYDMYDYAVAGPILEDQANENLVMECAAVQEVKAATHVSISSFLMTQNPAVHKFLAETLMPRWVSLQSLKLSSLNIFDVDIFLPAILHLISKHTLRQICFEDTQFTNPMRLFIEILRVLLKYDSIVMKKLTMIGIGHPFVGNFTQEISAVAQFRGITKLDLSFSSLSDTTSTNTFAEYIKRDQALRSLNLNCCRLLNGESTAYLLRSIGDSTITELVVDFNKLTGQVAEDAFIYMLTNNRLFQTISASLCGFTENFIKTRLLIALGELPSLNQLYISENRIGDMVELKDLIIKLLTTRPMLHRLDISSNYLSGRFLRDLAESLVRKRGRTLLFNGLNISFNMSQNETSDTKDFIKDTFTSLSEYLNCMILYEDYGVEHAAQM